MIGRQKLLWVERAGDLVLLRGAEKKIVARVYQLDGTRWLAFVLYDSPGYGAASVKPSRAAAIEWACEAVASVWPHEAAAPTLGGEPLQTEETL